MVEKERERKKVRERHLKTEGVVEFRGQSFRVGVFSTLTEEKHYYSFLVAASSYTTSRVKQAKISLSLSVCLFLLFIHHYRCHLSLSLNFLPRAKADCFQKEA